MLEKASLQQTETKLQSDLDALESHLKEKSDFSKRQAGQHLVSEPR